MLLAPAFAKSTTRESTGDTIKCTSIGAFTPALRSAAQTNGPIGEIGDVMVVHDVEVNPVGAGGENRVHFLAQPREIRGQNRGQKLSHAHPSSHASRRAYAFVGFLDALSFFFRHLCHRLRQAVGHEFIRMMPAHLAPIGLGDFLIADVSLHLELRIALRQGPAGSVGTRRTPWPVPRPHRCLHVREFEAGHSQPLGDPRQYRPRRRRYAVARERRAQLQLHKGPQQVIAQAAGFAQPLDAEFGIVIRAIFRS